MQFYKLGFENMHTKNLREYMGADGYFMLKYNNINKKLDAIMTVY